MKCRALIGRRAAVAVGFALAGCEPVGVDAQGARDRFSVPAARGIAVGVSEVLDRLVLNTDALSQGAPRGRRLCLLHGPSEAFGVRVHAVECVIASVQMCLCFAGRSFCRAGRKCSPGEKIFGSAQLWIQPWNR